MSYTTINKSSDYFNTKLFTGTGSSNALTGVGFQPDWVWIKDRQDTHNHNLFDAVRGVTKRIYSDTSDAETTNAESLKSFDSDGFTLGTQTNVNQSGHTNVAWNWKAGGSGSANTDGTINSTVSVNTTAGFSIVKYTGTGANATVGHGLGAVPKMIIIKELNNATNWIVYHTGVGNGGSLQLNTTIGTDTDSTFWNSTTPTSSVFTLGSNGNSNGSSDNYIAYCFAEKAGYSKFGKYTGNGNADGTFVYTGFKPAFLLLKKNSASGQQWYIYDDKRDGKNQGDGASGCNRSLRTNTTSAEEQASGYPMDILSNGFKWRGSSGEQNGSGDTYIYMAIGQSIVGSNNVPCTAR